MRDQRIAGGQGITIRRKHVERLRHIPHGVALDYAQPATVVAAQPHIENQSLDSTRLAYSLVTLRGVAAAATAMNVRSPRAAATIARTSSLNEPVRATDVTEHFRMSPLRRQLGTQYF